VITYFDTSYLLKLILIDEDDSERADRLWLESDHVACAEIGYVEARAALGAARRANRIDGRGLTTAKRELAALWAQLDHVGVTSELLTEAGDTAEHEGLRGYDAVHLTAAVRCGATTMASGDAQLLAAAARNGLDISMLDPPTRS
jgi:predicted nucleic acid-binding protein